MIKNFRNINTALITKSTLRDLSSGVMCILFSLMALLIIPSDMSAQVQLTHMDFVVDDCSPLIIGDSIEFTGSSTCDTVITMMYSQDTSTRATPDTTIDFNSFPFTFTFDKVGVYYFYCSMNGNTGMSTIPSKVPADQCFTVLGDDSPDYDITFSDPCRCDDPNNVTYNGIYYFHDTLTAYFGLADTTLLGPHTNMFNYVGGAIIPFPDSAVFEEVIPDSVFQLEFWRPSGTVTTANAIFQVGSNYVDNMVPDSIFLPSCDIATCPVDEVIPTLSEWGIVILLLTMLIVGVIIIRTEEMECQI